jgi:hypothetical protein
MFSGAPGGRYDMGRFAAPAFGQPVKMGCELHDASTGEVNEEDIDPLTLACRKCKKKNRSAGRMGEIRLAGGRLGDDILDAAKSVFDGLLSAAAAAVTAVPPAVAGAYSTRLKTCQDMVGGSPNTGSYVAAGECLRRLVKDIESGTGLTPPQPTIPMAPQAAPFPIIPVALAGVAVLAVLYFYTNRNQEGSPKKVSRRKS